MSASGILPEEQGLVATATHGMEGGATGSRNPPSKRIRWVDKDRCLAVHVGPSCNIGNQVVAFETNPALEDAPDNALDPEDVAFRELAVPVQARKLGARSGAARGAVVFAAGAADIVPCVGDLGGADQFDVVDCAAIDIGYPL